MPGPSDDLAAAVRHLLTERGPLAQEDVFDSLIAAGIDVGPDRGEALLDALELDPGPVLQLADDRWAWIPAVLDGRMFTTGSAVRRPSMTPSPGTAIWRRCRC